MSRGPCTFKQQDVTRALRASVAAGIEVQRVEINRDGKIVLVMGPSEPTADADHPHPGSNKKIVL